MNKIKELLVNVSIGENFKTREGKFYPILITEGAVILILRIMLFIEFLFAKKKSINPNVLNEENSLFSKIITSLLLPYKIDLSIFDHIDNPDLVDHIRRVGKVFYHQEKAETSIGRID